MHAQQHPEGLRHHNGRVPKVGEVNHEQRERSHGRKKELVAPAQVQNVIGKAQENHAADGEERTDELHELRNREGNPDYQRPLPARARHAPSARPGKPHLVIRKGRALLLHEASQEGHGDEAEEGDQEHGPADHALCFGAETKARRAVSPADPQPGLGAGAGAAPAPRRTVQRGSATHTGCREALLRSSPNSRAARKWSLKAGISVTVAAKPSSDPPRLMRRGTAGQAAMAAAGAAPAKGKERGRAQSAARRRPPPVSSRRLERRHRMRPPAHRRGGRHLWPWREPPPGVGLCAETGRGRYRFRLRRGRP